MCHEESTSVGSKRISASAGDGLPAGPARADLIVISGQNRGPTTHGCCPRWKS
ncbi:hypothetical protein HBB16_02225 [Pseudonocardia sp. MCCB 268]|nr:hypothetical protein [Pseudonocardia cytotoxica]